MNRNRPLVRLNLLSLALPLLALALLAATLRPAPTGASPAADQMPPQPAHTLDKLRKDAAQHGSVPVIVELDVPFVPEPRLPAQARARQREQIARAQQRVATALGGKQAKSLTQLTVVPLLLARLDVAGLDALQGHPDVRAIREDARYKLMLAESTSLIGAPSAWASGYTGAGTTIAIIDSGINSTHPFLRNKIVDEACYSSDDPNLSTCPGGAPSAFGWGSGGPCYMADCDHGTHVAGIAAGKNGSSGGVTFNGVAPDASLISINVTSKFFDNGTCSAGCVDIYMSDVVQALERVYFLHMWDFYNIVAVNLSLGTLEAYSTACPGDSAASIIDTLREANVAVVAATGNEYNPNGIIAPACTPAAISVGSSNDSSTGSADTLSSFTNAAPFMSLLAPGNLITSSAIGDPMGYTYESKWGTSMATPHVAGAWALLRQKSPSASVGELLWALQSTGVPISDTRVSPARTYRRIDVAAALAVSSFPPTLSAGDVSITESPNGPLVANVPVTLSAPASADVTLRYLTGDGSALAVKNDYALASGVLTIPAGSTSASIPVTILDDDLDERDQTFELGLYQIAGPVAVKDPQASITIVDDDATPQLRLMDVIIREAEGPYFGFVYVQIEMSGRSEYPITVDYGDVPETATHADYQRTYTLEAGPDKIKIAAGATRGSGGVGIERDNLDEPLETARILISNPVNATIADGEAILTIQDAIDDGPTISLVAQTIAEGRPGGAGMVVTLSAPTHDPVTVYYRTVQRNSWETNVAVAGEDYTHTDTTLTIPAGATSGMTSIPFLDDELDEYDESLIVELTYADGGNLSTYQATLTIADDDAPPVITISLENDLVAEGQFIDAFVTLSKPSAKQISVSYGTADGSASGGSDYVVRNEGLVITPGSLSVPLVWFQTKQDALDEPNETFFITLPSVENATSAGPASITIDDDDDPLVGVADSVSVIENNSGSKIVNVALTLSGQYAPSQEEVVVGYVVEATPNAARPATPGLDFVAVASGSARIPVGATSVQIPITLLGDTLDEYAETFRLRLVSAQSATLSTDNKLVVTITDNDDPPTISVQGSSVVEGTNVTRLAPVTVVLSAPSGKEVTVVAATADSTATGADYRGFSQTLTVEPGSTSASTMVFIVSDAVDETNESLLVNINNPTNATIATTDDTQTAVYIQDDDNPEATINNRTIAEGDSGTKQLALTISLSAASPQSSRVDWATEDAGALAGSDYLAASGSVTFQPGETTKVIYITILGDTLFEEEERFRVRLTGGARVELTTTGGWGIIANDD